MAGSFSDTNFGTLRGFHNFAVYLEKFRIIFPKIGFSDYKFHGKDSSRLPVKIHIGLLAQADYRGMSIQVDELESAYSTSTLFRLRKTILGFDRCLRLMSSSLYSG